MVWIVRDYLSITFLRQPSADLHAVPYGVGRCRVHTFRRAWRPQGGPKCGRQSQGLPTKDLRTANVARAPSPANWQGSVSTAARQTPDSYQGKASAMPPRL